tara:strand:- start:877 stop:1815 length:939 start_codon:yes stop_codon:yes gene_type:complete
MYAMDLLSSKKRIGKTSLIALRIIFNSNNGLYKLLKEGLSLNKIQNLDHVGLKHFKFKNIDEVLKKLSNFDLFEEQAINIIDWCDNNNVKIIDIFDEYYPQNLLEIKSPPCLIFCKGNIDLLNNKKSIAIVGTRNSTNYGRKITQNVSSFFAEKNINIVSGLAMGIDTFAHQASLDVGGYTTAVLVDIKTISPTSNAKLAENIINNNGLIFSENIPGTQPSAGYLFTERNRLQTAISKALIVIESSVDSGTSSTCKHALDQGIKIFCSDLRSIKDYPEVLFENSLNKKLVNNEKAIKFTKKNYDLILNTISY